MLNISFDCTNPRWTLCWCVDPKRQRRSYLLYKVRPMFVPCSSYVYCFIHFILLGVQPSSSPIPSTIWGLNFSHIPPSLLSTTAPTIISTTLTLKACGYFHLLCRSYLIIINLSWTSSWWIVTGSNKGRTCFAKFVLCSSNVLLLHSLHAFGPSVLQFANFFHYLRSRLLPQPTLSSFNHNTYHYLHHFHLEGLWVLPHQVEHIWG